MPIELVRMAGWSAEMDGWWVDEEQGVGGMAAELRGQSFAYVIVAAIYYVSAFLMLPAWRATTRCRHASNLIHATSSKFVSTFSSDRFPVARLRQIESSIHGGGWRNGKVSRRGRGMLGVRGMTGA